MAEEKHRGRGRTSRPNRVTADITSIEYALENYPDLPNADKTWPEWAAMTRPQKLIHLAQRGVEIAEQDDD